VFQSHVIAIGQVSKNTANHRVATCSITVTRQKKKDRVSAIQLRRQGMTKHNEAKVYTDISLMIQHM